MPPQRHVDTSRSFPVPVVRGQVDPGEMASFTCAGIHEDGHAPCTTGTHMGPTVGATTVMPAIHRQAGRYLVDPVDNANRIPGFG